VSLILLPVQRLERAKQLISLHRHGSGAICVYPNTSTPVQVTVFDKGINNFEKKLPQPCRQKLADQNIIVVFSIQLVCVKQQ
jgi:hypothetical protein